MTKATTSGGTRGFSRRTALKGFTLGAASASMIAPETALAADPPPAAAQPEGVCVLFPQAVEGPYYFDPKLERADISEDRPGAPLRLTLKVIESGPCTPLTKARVDVWHADASGVYSGYDGQGAAGDLSTKGQTYLRGTQFTDDTGSVQFKSVYPGWYPGRTPHIHVKVFIDTKTLVTGQIYFPDAMSAEIYTSRAPYNVRPKADTSNGQDFIFKSGERDGGGTVLSVSADGEAVVAGLVIAIDRSGGAARKAAGWSGWLRERIGW